MGLGLPMASLNLYTPGSGKPVAQTKTTIHTAHWANLQTEIIIGCIK